MVKEAEIINIDEDLGKAVQYAKKLFLEGKVFVYPTDTIYGFGANPFNEDAVKKIAAIKKRNLDKLFILLISSIDNLLKYIDVKSEKHLDFLISVWPNPVSVVLNLNQSTQNVLGYPTAAFRIPNNRFCLKLLAGLNMPLISTSVNRSNQPPLTDHNAIMEEFSPEIDALFYTEKKSFFQASTIVDLTESKPVLLREGRIKLEEILEKYK